MTTEEGNKIIAKFDGAKVDKKSYNEWWYEVKNTDRYGYISQLQYHSSWDWLMPVVEKIESIHNDFHGKFGVYISSNNCSIQGSNFNLKGQTTSKVYFNDKYGKTKIEAVWLAVIEFINWYNKNKDNG